MIEPELLRRIVEAALLAAPQPLSVAALQALFPEDGQPESASIEQALQALADENGRRGVRLIEVASGWRFQVDSELQPWIARMWTERPARYSRALLETLALIAYRQPITRGEIEQIRGVAVSTHIIKTLEEREWIRVVGHRDVPGRPALFGTTRGFLDYFGLKALDELPPLTELQDLPELEPELPLEPLALAKQLVALPVDETVEETAEADAEADPNADSESDADADVDTEHAVECDTVLVADLDGEADAHVTPAGASGDHDNAGNAPEGAAEAHQPDAAATAEADGNPESTAPAADVGDVAEPDTTEHPDPTALEAPRDAAPEPDRHE